MAEKFRLTFHGGAGTVTGANFLLEPADGSKPKILVDCGLVQGAKFCSDCNRDPFPYDPATIDHLFVTHAHMDHTGRVPLLLRRGFRGRIYSTPATKELAEVMLIDSRGVMEKEAKRDGMEPLYEEQDVRRALSQWETLEYHEEKVLENGLSAELYDAGHILGSAMVQMKRNGRSIVFSGDLGNSPAPLLRDTESVAGATYLVMESVYGDRVHEGVMGRRERLRDIICSTITKKGVLLIPAFSIERTQVLLYEINNLVEEGKIPSVPVFLDSPLAIAVTDIYRRRTKHFNEGVKNEIAGGDDTFSFPQLQFTKTVEESKAINVVPPPKVIIAGAGMSHGGRIQHHEKRYLSLPNTTLLLVGFQVAESLGRRLQSGMKEVTIHNDVVKVRARIETVGSYSAHRDRDGLVDFVSTSGSSLERVFVTMGEPRAALALVQRLRDFLDVDATAPEKGESVEIEL